MAGLTPQKLTALSNRLTRLEQRAGFQRSSSCPEPTVTPADRREALKRLIESGAFLPQMARSPAAWWWWLGEALFGPSWRETAATAARTGEREGDDGDDHREEDPMDSARKRGS